MKATILDTETGAVAVEDGPRSWEWAENNWSCDCNRGLAFKSDDDELDVVGTCDGCHRYLVVSAEMGPGDYEYILEDLNAGYPAELLRKHGIS